MIYKDPVDARAHLMGKRVLYLILEDDADEISNQIVADYPRADEETLHDVDLIRHRDHPNVAGDHHNCKDQIA